MNLSKNCERIKKWRRFEFKYDIVDLPPSKDGWRRTKPGDLTMTHWGTGISLTLSEEQMNLTTKLNKLLKKVKVEEILKEIKHIKEIVQKEIEKENKINE